MPGAGGDTGPGRGDPAGRYRLTPAEARLAQALSGGEALAEAASRFAITAATARSQLKAIFAKTGATRQADLVRLVAGLAR